MEYYFVLKKLILIVLNNKDKNRFDAQFWIQKILLKKKFMEKSI